MSTGFVDAGFRGQERGERRAGRLAERRAGSRPAASQASAQRIPSPPAFVSTATRRPFSSGWFASSAATSSSSSSESARITPAWWKSASTAASEPASAAVCELAARWPVAVVPLLSARIGFVRATRRASAAEAARVAERLDVHQHDLGRLVVLPPLEEVVGGDVGLVADRHERRETEAARLGRLQQGEAEGAALRGEPDVAGRGRAGGEGRVETRPGDGDAEAVGPDQPRAVGAHEREQLLLPLQAFAADLGEAGRDHDERADALAQRLLRRLDDRRAGKGDHREVDRIGNLLDRGVGAYAGDRLTVAVDRDRRRRRSRPRGCCGTARRRSSRAAWRRRSRRHAPGSEERARARRRPLRGRAPSTCSR